MPHTDSRKMDKIPCNAPPKAVESPFSGSIEKQQPENGLLPAVKAGFRPFPD